MKISFAIKSMICLVLIAGLLSCKKMLKEYNPSQVTAEAVYTTAVGYETLVNGAYSYSRSWYGKEDGLGLAETGTDLWTGGSETYNATSDLALNNRALITYQNLSPVNTNVTRLWKQLYAGVNLCNLGIKISTDGSFDGTPPANRVAELKFLRAFYYWHIVETWGGVHFTTEPTTTTDLTANKTPESTFYDQIITDLTDAMALPAPSSADYGRTNKNAAKAFLARVYLTRAYKTWNTGGSSADFTKAKDLAEDVILNGGYTLENNYIDLWKMTNQKSNEVIWSVNYSLDLNLTDAYNKDTNPGGYGNDILSATGSPTTNRGNNGLHAVFIPLYDRTFDSSNYSRGTYGMDSPAHLMLKRDVRNGWPFCRLAPTKFLMDAFDETMDSRYKGSFQTVWKVNVNTAGGSNLDAGSRSIGKIPYVDTALYITKNPATPNPVKKYYYYNVYDLYNSPIPTSKSVTFNQLFPALWKFQDSTRSTSPNDLITGSAFSEKDVPVMRLAEMYMIAAEAYVALGDPGNAATKINVLRTRAAIKTPVDKRAAMQVSSGVVDLEFILDERAREFAGENIRWFDLKRTGKLQSRIQAYNPDISPNFQPCYTVRPIPQTQIDVVTNKDVFTQNACW